MALPRNPSRCATRERVVSRDSYRAPNGAAFHARPLLSDDPSKTAVFETTPRVEPFPAFRGHPEFQEATVALHVTRGGGRRCRGLSSHRDGRPRGMAGPAGGSGHADLHGPPRARGHD